LTLSQTQRLDRVFAPDALPDLSYLVKLDVDGVEEQIIAGGQRVLRNALVDLVMINNRLRAAELKFRPWEYSEGKVHWPKWQHGFKHLDDTPVDDPFA
jgi:hypothetical protein